MFGAGSVGHPANVAGADGDRRYGQRVSAASAGVAGGAGQYSRPGQRSRFGLHRRIQSTGEFESGVTAGWFGLVPVVLPGGTLTLGVTAVWMWRLPTLRTMDRFPTAATHSAAKH